MSLRKRLLVPDHIYSGIALFAIFNTGLLNFIMGSRVVYGMARQRLLPAALKNPAPGRSDAPCGDRHPGADCSVPGFVGNIRDLGHSNKRAAVCWFLSW